jgi:hypothetical protein
MAVKYVIRGRYDGRTEDVDEADNKAEAERMLGEYRLSFGGGWCLWLVKVTEEEEEGE